MTVFEKIKSMDIEEFVKWLDNYHAQDDSLWINWWDKNYCNKCEPEIAYIPYFNREMECAWCEMHGKCKFFEDMDNTPDTKEIIKMWLESELV